MKKRIITFKIVMLGDSRVGKTCLTYRYISGNFLTDLKSTIGTALYTKTLNLNNRVIKLQIWDFAGEEKFWSLLKSYVVGANGAVLLYDITNRDSFSHLEEWLDVVRDCAGDIPVMLIGSKLDLEDSRNISREEGKKAAQRFNLFPFFELSSKSGENVEEALKNLVEILIVDLEEWREMENPEIWED